MFIKASSLTLLLGAISTCADAVGDDPIEIETGPAITRSVDAQTFDRLTVAGRYDVIVVPGEITAIEMSGPERLLDNVRYDFSDGALRIYEAERKGVILRWADNMGVTIRITSPGISEAAIAGSGDVRVEEVEGGAFTGSIKGSGDLKVERLAVGRASFTIEGSGDVAAAGTTEQLDVAIAGSGDFQSRGLDAAIADIRIAGSGDVDARVTDTAAVKVRGSGDVSIGGGAECTIDKDGSGDVTCTA